MDFKKVMSVRLDCGQKTCFTPIIIYNLILVFILMIDHLQLLLVNYNVTRSVLHFLLDLNLSS